jgi:membrane-bound lytic murein transglycosylase D
MGNSSLDSRLASYEPWVRLIRREEGIPEELVCLSIVESLSIHKLFACGARGLWQIMTETDWCYGLRQSGGFDERDHV